MGWFAGPGRTAVGDTCLRATVRMLCAFTDPAVTSANPDCMKNTVKFGIVINVRGMMCVRIGQGIRV